MNLAKDGDNSAQSHDQKTYLAGSIARALAVFCVDEVVIFEDEVRHHPQNDVNDDEYTAYSDPSHFLAHVLSYLETPPHLRKYLFPMHRNLRTAGTLPSLDMPHHVRANEWCEYREGVTVADDQEAWGAEKRPNKKQGKKDKKKTDTGKTTASTLVHTGLPERVQLEGVSIPEKTRVTVRFRTDNAAGGADAVAPSAPREEAGYYWGYSVRRCGSLSDVFMECPFDGGYDLSFGTSERGKPLDEVVQRSETEGNDDGVPAYRHLLVVFGGVAGLEAAVKSDEVLRSKDVVPAEAGRVFDYYVNVLPGQGSRTIRTEEAVWLGLMGLRGVINNHV